MHVTLDHPTVGLRMTMIHLEYYRPGKGTAHFDEHLVLDRPDVKVLFLERYEDVDVRNRDSIILEKGAPVIWYVFPETWHDVGRFHDADGAFTGWYTNLCTPIEMDGDCWRTRDLFLDLWQPVEGDAEWLDEDELETAVKQGLVDRATMKRIKNERVMLDLQLCSGSWPPPIARDIDLDQVKVLLQV